MLKGPIEVCGDTEVLAGARHPLHWRRHGLAGPGMLRSSGSAGELSMNHLAAFYTLADGMHLADVVACPCGSPVPRGVWHFTWAALAELGYLHGQLAALLWQMAGHR